MLRKKLDGLEIKELGCHPDDNKVRSQGSKFQDRQFLPNKKERDIVIELVTGSIDMDTFISNDQIKSSSGQMLKDLVNGQRKLKKADKSGGGGHLGCSSSYNSSKYQNDLNINTQGREQTNALIEKCAQTLRQKNYFNFMRYMKIFFAIRNLIATKRINI